jgi:hypothetical protein
VRTVADAAYVNNARWSGEENVRVPVPAGVRDLADVAAPIGTSLPRADEWSRVRLTDAQVSAYHSHGYISNVPVSVAGVSVSESAAMPLDVQYSRHILHLASRHVPSRRLCAVLL